MMCLTWVIKPPEEMVLNPTPRHSNKGLLQAVHHAENCCAFSQMHRYVAFVRVLFFFFFSYLVKKSEFNTYCFFVFSKRLTSTLK